MTKPYILDMKLSDPDSLISLIFLLGHPKIDLKAILVTPGTREQIGLVQWMLKEFNKDIPIGSFNIEDTSICTSSWPYTVFKIPIQKTESIPGWELLKETLNSKTTLVVEGPLKNLGRFLKTLPLEEEGKLGKLFIQGGFSGEGIASKKTQLSKFKGLSTYYDFNLNEDKESVFELLRRTSLFSEIRFVSTNLGENVAYTKSTHSYINSLRSSWCQYHAECSCPCHYQHDILHISPCCNVCPICGARILDFIQKPSNKRIQSLSMIFQGMEFYLSSYYRGMTFPNVFTSCCAINSKTAKWKQIELYNSHDEWGSFPNPYSKVKITTDFHYDKFLETFVM